MSFKKVFLKNSQQSESIEPTFQMYLPTMQAIVSDWNSLNVGSLSTVEFVGLISGTTGPINGQSPTTEQVLTYAEELAMKRFFQKAKPNGQSPMIRGFAISDGRLLEILGRPDTQSLKSRLQNFHSKASAQINSIRDFIVLDNDRLSINKDALELHKSSTALYISNPDEQRFYDTCMKLKEAVRNYISDPKYDAAQQPSDFLPFFSQLAHTSVVELFEKKKG